MKKPIVKSLVSVILFLLMSHNVFSEVSEYPFEVKISGSGTQSIIFIPGFACSGEVWDETKKQYESNYKCYVLTMAGFAGVAPGDVIKFSEWEKGIADYIKQNKIDKPIIIGHSMGGALAMALASDYPDMVSKIIVVDALPCLAALMDPSFKPKENNDCSKVTNEITKLNDEEFYQMQKKVIPQLIADSSKAELVINWSVKSDRKTFGEMYCDFSNTDLRDKIANIKCPALILLESYFENIKPSVTEQYKNLKSADLRYATKGLHFIMYDDKEWFDKQLSEFIGQ